MSTNKNTLHAAGQLLVHDVVDVDECDGPEKEVVGFAVLILVGAPARHPTNVCPPLHPAAVGHVALAHIVDRRIAHNNWLAHFVDSRPLRPNAATPFVVAELAP